MRALSLALASACLLSTTTAAALETKGTAGCVMRAPLVGLFTADDARYVKRAIHLAESAGCEAVLLVVDSPGGHLGATRATVEAILRSRVPVVAWVPPGAHAGAAAALVVLSAHVASLATGATLGFGLTAPLPADELGSTRDNAALARFLAAHRNRNASWAERAVHERATATADEAALLGAVDVVADAEAALLLMLDGDAVNVLGAARRFSTANAEVRDAPESLHHVAARALADPTVLYLLLMLGMLGVLLELYRPGSLVPGIVGSGAILVAAYGLQLVPVDLLALALLVVALALFAAELRVRGFGAFTVGGVVALLLGSTRLVDAHDPGFFVDIDPHVSWSAVLPIAGVLGGVTALLSQVARR